MSRKKENVRYLSVEELLTIHLMVMDGYFVDYEDHVTEETPGIKDVNAFLSALNLPRQTYDGKDLYPTILEKAAALMRSLIKNHPFQNGNKRTAVLATLLFLEINFYSVTATQTQLFRLAMSIVHSSKPKIDRIVRTLKKFSRYIYVDRKEQRTLIEKLQYAAQKIFGKPPYQRM
ncbi:type II toxin-antitoxin system death-on-curing family toxin [Brevibacillus agri]|uniref:type II toxin-antitoxin system death-on-curing family toxin n=1 Tax=Brevibacillus agri TaxID=51101 RepID=UPI003D21FADB